MGWTKVPPEEMQQLKEQIAKNAATAKPQLHYPCYDGPCVDGRRYVCFYETDPPGCTDCYYEAC